MAVGRRDTDHGIVRFNEHEHGGQHPRGLAVHHGDIVTRRVAAQMIEAELSETVAKQRRRQLIIVKRNVVGRTRQVPFEAAEVEHGIGTALGHPRLDHPPGMTELGDVILGGAEKITAGIRDAGCMRVAVTVRLHLLCSPEICLVAYWPRRLLSSCIARPKASQSPVRKAVSAAL